jgi:S-adenosylmethionine/arginine decarboxylase-like enzyme
MGSLKRPQIGVNLLINLYDVLNEDLLRSVWYVRPIITKILERLNLQIIDEASNQFDNNGFSMAFVMPESNLTLYTHYKLKICYINIFSCNEEFNSSIFLKLIKDAFDTENVTYSIMRR